MRLSLVFLMLVMLGLGSAVYMVADDVRATQRAISDTNGQIADEKENLRVLQAEWTFLTKPERLQKLAVENFGLQPTDGAQYVELAAIPLRDFVQEQEQLAAAEPKSAPVARVMKLAQAPVADQVVMTDDAPLLPAALPVSAIAELSDE